MSQIYLDNHTTTRPSPAAIDAMRPFLEEKWGTPLAPHAMGAELFPAMKEAYSAIYALLGGHEADTFVFTSSGTEAINHVVWSTYWDVVRETGKNQLITAAIDEAPAVLAFERLQELGCELTLLPVDRDGRVTADALREALSHRTAIVSLSWANALTGVLQPVEELAEACRERGVLFHLDASQVLGKIAFDLDDISPDFLSFNGDHFHAPKGTGGLLVRSGLSLSPMLLGAPAQAGLRAGPFSVPLLVALGVAAREAIEGRDRTAIEVARLRVLLEEKLVELTPSAQLLFQDVERLPTTTAVAFPGVTSDALLYLLNRRGVLASFGGGNYQQLGRQLETMGYASSINECAVSFSLSRYSLESEVVEAAAIIAKSVSELECLSSDLLDQGREDGSIGVA